MPNAEPISKKIDVLLLDETQFTRAGLRHIVEKHPDFCVRGEAGSVPEVVKLLHKHMFDVIVVSTNLHKENIFITLMAQNSLSAVVAITPIVDGLKVRAILEEGVSCYLFNNCSEQQLFEAIGHAANGKKYYSAEVVSKVMQSFGKKYDHPESTGEELTEREQEILRLILDEYNNQEIADKLSISLRTVDSHKRNLLKKTDSRNVAGLILYGYKHDLI